MNTYTFHVSGTHCASCKILIEDMIGEHEGVKGVRVDLKEKTVEVSYEGQLAHEALMGDFQQKIGPHGYTLSSEKIEAKGDGGSGLWPALAIGLTILVLFFLLQKSGLLNLGIGGNVTPVTSFIIGLIASVSSCLAIVGGLVLSLSAKISEDDTDDTKTFALFHAGRIVSFALLGGVLGAIGGAIGVSFTFSAILGLIASVVMILLGLDLAKILSRKSITLPSGIFGFFRSIEHKAFAPVALGFGTFFLPCGFTQSMQISALGSGSFVSGLLIMLSYVLGTLPVLALLSFGSASFARSKHAPLFFKSAGIVVIGLGLFSLFGGLAGLGIIRPLFNI